MQHFYKLALLTLIVSFVGVMGVSAQEVENTGPGSEVDIEERVICDVEVENNTNVDVENNNDQEATSGNSTGGSSGNAGNTSETNVNVEVDNSNNPDCIPPEDGDNGGEQPGGNGGEGSTPGGGITVVEGDQDLPATSSSQTLPLLGLGVISVLLGAGIAARSFRKN